MNTATWPSPETCSDVDDTLTRSRVPEIVIVKSIVAPSGNDVMSRASSFSGLRTSSVGNESGFVHTALAQILPSGQSASPSHAKTPSRSGSSEALKQPLSATPRIGVKTKRFIRTFP